MDITPPRTTFSTVLLSLVLVLIYGCEKPPIEQELEKNILELEQAIEDKDPSAVLDHIHKDFIGEKGQDKKWVQRTLAFHTLRNHQIEIVISNIKITVKDPHTAIGSFNALATGGHGLLPERGAIYQVELEWRKEGGDWKIVYAKWKKNLAP